MPLTAEGREVDERQAVATEVATTCRNLHQDGQMHARRRAYLDCEVRSVVIIDANDPDHPGYDDADPLCSAR